MENMKRMKLRIGISFVVILVAGIVVSRVYVDSIPLGLETGLSGALTYLFYVWAHTWTDKHRSWLHTFEVASMVLMAALILFTYEGLEAFSNLEWKDLLLIVYYGVGYMIANKHGEELCATK